MRECEPAQRIGGTAGGSLARRIAAGGFLAIVLTTVFIAPASAHGWQNATTAGEHELGLHTNSANPVADAETVFLAHIRNTSAPQDTRRAVGVANETVSITITGPNGTRDRLTATMPENGSRFAFSYRFPTAGTYAVTARTTIDGERVALRTEQWVAAPTTPADDAPRATASTTPDAGRTGTDGDSGTQRTEAGNSRGGPQTETGSTHDALRRKLTTIQLLAGASVLVAAGALWAAVLAYRGTD